MRDSEAHARTNAFILGNGVLTGEDAPLEPTFAAD
jgi:hypothetical protein